jgi:hypothetical protein
LADAAGENARQHRGDLSNILTPFNYPPFDELMAGRSTLSLAECIDQGKVLYVHFPIARAA